MHKMRLAKKIFSYLKHSYDVRELMLLVALCYWLYVVNMKIFYLYIYLREKSEGWSVLQTHLWSVITNNTNIMWNDNTRAAESQRGYWPIQGSCHRVCVQKFETATIIWPETRWTNITTNDWSTLRTLLRLAAHIPPPQSQRYILYCDIILEPLQNFQNECFVTTRLFGATRGNCWSENGECSVHAGS